MIWSILMVIVGLGLFFWRLSISEDFETKMLLIIIFFVWLCLSPVPVLLIGFHYETGRGEHIGYITATQKQGIFFKTGRAYVKTDIQSSQEDNYCVMEENVFKTLQQLAEKKEKVKIKYFSYFSSGVKNCEGEDDIIYSVEIIK